MSSDPHATGSRAEHLERMRQIQEDVGMYERELDDATRSHAASIMEPGDGQTHEGWEGCCTLGHVHPTASAGQWCECGYLIRFKAAAHATPDCAAKMVEALADRPGAPKSEQKVASAMIYREHALAIVRGEPIDPQWFYGGKVPK